MLTARFKKNATVTSSHIIYPPGILYLISSLCGPSYAVINSVRKYMPNKIRLESKLVNPTWKNGIAITVELCLYQTAEYYCRDPVVVLVVWSFHGKVTKSSRQDQQMQCTCRQPLPGADVVYLNSEGLPGAHKSRCRL